MIDLIKKIRESIVGALAYVRANQHDEKNDPELTEWQGITDNELAESLSDIDDFLEHNKPHHNN